MKAKIVMGSLVAAMIWTTLPCMLSWAQDERTFDTPAFEVNHKALVPLRALIEWFGGTVECEDSQITVFYGQQRVELQIGKSTATVNEQTITLNIPPRIINGLTYVHVRFLAETFGWQVEYDPVGPHVLIGTASKIARFQVKQLVQKKRIARTVKHRVKRKRPSDLLYDPSVGGYVVHDCTGRRIYGCRWVGECKSR